MVTVQTLIACGLSVVTTLILCLFARPLCTKLKLLDVPSARKLHRIATPLVGGLALAVVVLPISLIYSLLYTPPQWHQPAFIYTFATMAMVLMGMEDDRRAISARTRLLLSLIVFGSVALFNPIFNVRSLRFAEPALEIGMGIAAVGYIFTTVCCVGLINALNMADGKNGLVIGLCLGWLPILSERAPPVIDPLIYIMMAALLVLLWFNMRGRLFLGDGGVYGLACGIALLTIATYNSPGSYSAHAIAGEQIMLLFGVPVLDSFRLTFARMRRGQSPMAPDRDHFHHHLQTRFGWPWGLIVYLAIALIPASLAFGRIIPTLAALALVVLLYVVTIVVAHSGQSVTNSSKV